MSVYHQNAITGAELKQAIGNVTNITGFDNNPHAEGASANDFYGIHANAAPDVAPTNNDPSGPTLA